MSFRLQIDNVENLGGETCIRGRLIEGAYFGPQSIRVKDSTGKSRTATILSHELINPQDWPVTADHGTQLVLHIAKSSPPFIIDAGSPVEGLGSVALRRDCIDLSRELSEPLFWGNFSTLYMVSEENDSPYEEFLGLSQNDVNNYYTRFLAPLINSKTWPIFPLVIDRDRYVDVEWAGGAEYQDRVWIGSRVSEHRALLGYQSGHFSVPGLRPSELAWLLERIAQTTAHPASGLLLVPMCYLPEPDARLIETLANLCARIPGARVELADTMATNMVEHQVVGVNARWEWRASIGWCSTCRYSQRNPQSPLSILSEADFGFIDLFFSEVR
jgi:hypothetical protein